jgi:hypothetical protein
MEMLRNFHIRSRPPAPSLPQGKVSRTSGAIPAGGQGGNKLPPLPPPQPSQQGNNDKLQCSKNDGYLDCYRRALRNLSGNIPSNCELSIFIANQE